MATRRRRWGTPHVLQGAICRAIITARLRDRLARACPDHARTQDFHDRMSGKGARLKRARDALRQACDAMPFEHLASSSPSLSDR